MQKTRILKLSIYAVLVLCALPVFSTPKISIEAPTITLDIDSTLFGGQGALLQAQLDAIFKGSEFTTTLDKLEASANDELSKYGSQKELALGFGNANAYAAQSATLQGYQGYKLFSLMGGLLIGAQLPTFDPQEVTKIADNIQKDPDLYAGVSASFAFNLGVHAGPIFRIFSKDLGEKMDKFYFNIKYGMYRSTSDVEEVLNGVKFDTTNFGLGVNYQWIPRSPNIIGGLFMWRGVNFGSGLLYQSNQVSFSSQYTITQKFSSPVTTSGYSGTVDATILAEPKIKLGITTSTFSIPLEATTSVQLLWIFNLNVGAGIDLVFGNTDITAKAGSVVTVKDVSVTVATITEEIGSTSEDGKISVDASTKGIAPSFLRPRLMTGFGTQFGPVKIDIPLYYYFNTGLAFGITFGIVW